MKQLTAVALNFRRYTGSNQSSSEVGKSTPFTKSLISTIGIGIWLVLFSFLTPLTTLAQAADCPTIANTDQTSVTACTGYIIDSLQVKTSVFWPDKIELVRFDSPQTNPYDRTDGTSLGELISSNGIATMRTIAFPPTTLTTDRVYYVYGLVKPLPTDANCRPFALVTVTIKANATATIKAQEATCTGSESAADGWVGIVGFEPTDRYEVANNGLFSGESHPIPSDGIIVRNLTRTGKPETYGVRIYSAFGCFVERSVTLANISCACPPVRCVPIVIQKLTRVR
ncbi:hypothetical protein GCM10028808_18540 [Spirosoma migulaei]